MNPATGKPNEAADARVIADRLIGQLRTRDMRFVTGVLAEYRPEVLVPVAEAWSQDKRAWAWSEAQRYFLHPGFGLGHEFVIRRLIDRAIETNQNQAVAAAMVFGDRLIQKKWRTLADDARREPVKRVGHTRDTLPRIPADPRIPRRYPLAKADQLGPSGRPFSQATRHFLRRRLWRHMRSLAVSDAESYVREAAFAMRQYDDGDTSDGLKLMQCWGLLHIGYRNHPGLRFTKRRAVIQEGFSLQSIVTDGRAAGAYQELWHTASGKTSLARVAAEARSGLVRLWAQNMLASPASQPVPARQSVPASQSDPASQSGPAAQ